jgi:hypothetical protein
MVVSIDSTKKTTIRTPEQPRWNQQQFERFKRHLKDSLKQLGVTITGNIQHKKLNATVATISMGVRSSDFGSACSGSEDSGLDAVQTPQHEAFSLHLSRTISVVCGGLRAPNPPSKAVALIRAWILDRMLCLSNVPVAEPVPPAAKAAGGPTGSGGGASGPDVTGGGGGGADRGGGSENSNSKDSAANAEGTSGHQSRDQTTDQRSQTAVGCTDSPICEDDRETEDEDDTPPRGPATNPMTGALSGGPHQSHQTTLQRCHTGGEWNISKDKPKTGELGEASAETESDSDEDVDMSSADHNSMEAGDSGKAKARARVIAEVRSASEGLALPDSVLQGIDKILDVYQENGCSVLRMLSLDAKLVLVLAEYHGDNKSVLVPSGPLLPHGQFAIMISTRWRTKGRVKNDPAFRHSANTLQISARTKHLPTQCSVQPIRLFKYGACFGLLSRDRALKKASPILGFTSTLYSEDEDMGLWERVRTQKATAAEGILSDAVRQTVRVLESALDNLNQKGIAVGAGAIGNARISADNRIIFPDLSQSALFPETNNEYSRQAQNANYYMYRQNSSCGWKLVDPTGSDNEFTATFLNDHSVLNVLRSERQSGKDLALANLHESVPEDAPRTRARGTANTATKGIKKELAFKRDQQSVARNLSLVLRFPVLAPTDLEYKKFNTAMARIVNSGKGGKAIRQTVDFLAGACSGQHILDRHWKQCADWFLKSMGDGAGNPFWAENAAGHLFMTAYIPDPSLESRIRGNGVRVESSLFTLPKGWTLQDKSPQCSFLNERLPAVVLKLESEEKGNGIFAGQDISEKVLVCVYLGDYVSDPATRPLSRMVVHNTSSCGTEEWAYCFGIEDLRRCLEFPALGQSVNAPSRGEASNCSLERNQWATFIDENGKRKLAFPIYSDRAITDGE